MVKTDKNLGVEMLRVLLTLAVCLHHFRMYSDALPYGGAPPAVDGFFIISGYYLYKQFMKKEEGKEKSVVRYIRKRYKKFFPDYFLAFAVAFIFRLLIKAIPSDDWFGYVREALMIEFWGIDISIRINPPDWYCGYLLLAGAIVFIYIKRMRKCNVFPYVTVVLWMGIYAILARWVPYINIYPQYQSILHITILRAVAGLLLGVSVFDVSQRTSGMAKRLNKEARGISVLFLGVGLVYTLFWRDPVPYVDYIVVFSIAVLFYLLASMEEKCQNMHIRHIVEYIGELCFTIYLNHYLVAFIFYKYSLFRLLDWKLVSLCFLMIVFVFSNIIFLLRKHFFKFL